MQESFLECELVVTERTYSSIDLCSICGIHSVALGDLVAFGIVEPLEKHADGGVFDEAALHRAKRALRLHRELGLEGQGLALALDLLDEIEHLRRRIQQRDAR